jgi:hypothetical protein
MRKSGPIVSLKSAGNSGARTVDVSRLSDSSTRALNDIVFVTHETRLGRQAPRGSRASQDLISHSPQPPFRKGRTRRSDRARAQEQSALRPDEPGRVIVQSLAGRCQVSSAKEDTVASMKAAAHLSFRMRLLQRAGHDCFKGVLEAPPRRSSSTTASAPRDDPSFKF